MAKPLFKSYDIVDSTNDIAKELIRSEREQAHGIVVTANYQRKGRGRKNNIWESNVGENMLFSIIINPKNICPTQQFIVNEIVSVALRDFLQNLVPHKPVKIKWPNDIYICEKKITGILIDHIIMGDLLSYSIIGIGINVNQTDFNMPLATPTSLKIETGKQFDIEKLYADFSEDLLTDFEKFDIKKRPLLTATYMEHLFLLHKKHDFLINNKKTNASIEGVDDNGCLLLKMADGTIRSFELNSVVYL